jgi:hypothetical protein
MPLDPASLANHSLSRRRLDHLGIGLAGLCAVHCLLTLVVISALGLGGHFLLDENIHRIGLLLAILVAALTVGWTALRHRRTLPLAVAAGGLALMGGAMLTPHGVSELVLTLGGVTLVAAAHLINLRTAR